MLDKKSKNDCKEVPVIPNYIPSVFCCHWTGPKKGDAPQKRIQSRMDCHGGQH